MTGVKIDICRADITQTFIGDNNMVYKNSFTEDVYMDNVGSWNFIKTNTPVECYNLCSVTKINNIRKVTNARS